MRGKFRLIDVAFGVLVAGLVAGFGVNAVAVKSSDLHLADDSKLEDSQSDVEVLPEDSGLRKVNLEDVANSEKPNKLGKNLHNSNEDKHRFGLKGPAKAGGIEKIGAKKVKVEPGLADDFANYLKSDENSEDRLGSRADVADGEDKKSNEAVKHDLKKQRARLKHRLKQIEEDRTLFHRQLVPAAVEEENDDDNNNDDDDENIKAIENNIRETREWLKELVKKRRKERLKKISLKEDPVDDEKTKVKYDKKRLEEYDNSSWTSKFQEQIIWAYDKLFSYYHGNIADYEKKADKLYTVISNFVNKAQQDGCSNENFEDYIKAYIGDGKKIKVCSKDEFEKLCKKSKYKRVFRGVNDKKFAQYLMDGKFFVGGGTIYSDIEDFNVFPSSSASRKNVNGHGLFTTAQLHLAEHFAHQIVSNEKAGLKWKSHAGTVVELGIDSKAKFIKSSELEMIRIALLIFHPEVFGAAELFKRGFDTRSYGLIFSSIFEPFRKAFKKGFGFDVLDIKQEVQKAGKLSELTGLERPQYEEFVRQEGEDYVAYDKYDCMFYDLFSSYVINFLKYLVADNKGFAKEYDRLMMRNNEPPFYTNKFYAVWMDDGLLASLLGYDGVLYATEPTETIRIDSKGNSSEYTYYLVVNPDALLVCDEESVQSNPGFVESWVRSTKGSRFIDLGRFIAP